MNLVYALADPRETTHIRYVGMTTQSLDRRLSQHIYQSEFKNSPVHTWIRELTAQAVRPVIELLCEVPGTRVDLQKAEKDLIVHYSERLPKLLNVAKGGGGCLPGTKRSEETRRRMSAAQTGKKRAPFSAEHIAKLSVAQSSRIREPLSEETKHNISESLKGDRNPNWGKPRDPNIVAKIAAANRGKKRPPFSDEYRRKLSAAQKGRKHSEKTKRKISEAQKNRWLKV